LLWAAAAITQPAVKVRIADCPIAFGHRLLKRARKEYAAARWDLAQVAEPFPTLISPRAFLSHAILQEGKYWRAAEQALRGVLNPEPANTEAGKNFEILLRDHPHTKWRA